MHDGVQEWVHGAHGWAHGVHEWVHGMAGEEYEVGRRDYDVRVLGGGKGQEMDGIDPGRKVRIWVSNHGWHLEWDEVRDMAWDEVRDIQEMDVAMEQQELEARVNLLLSELPFPQKTFAFLSYLA